jgi:hypothetical protein
MFSSNTAGEMLSSARSTKAFGGALHIENLKTTIRSSSIRNNAAVGRLSAAGGGVSLGTGTASLLLEGNSTLSNNTCATLRDGSVSGSTIYSASGGAIILRNNTRIELDAGTDGTEIEVLSGAGRLDYDDGTRLQCTVGQKLEYNMTQQAESYEDWLIDCSLVQTDQNGVAMYSNPTCEQLCIPNKTELPSLAAL